MAPSLLPIIIAKWRRSQRECLRLTLHDDVFDLRAFYETDVEDAPLAGRVGITLPLRWLPRVIEALQKARREAERLGLDIDE